MNFLEIHKAQDGGAPVQPVSIRIGDAFPDLETLAEGSALHKKNAEKLLNALTNSLPGGTMDHLLAQMLEQKASNFVVAQERMIERSKKYESSSVDLFPGFNPDELLIMDGYDDCIVGVVERMGQDPIVCYDKEKILQKLIEDDGMDVAEAQEFIEVNQLNAWIGDRTPCFLSPNQ